MRSDELDARSDVYSLGVVVYEMLTGHTPFHSDTPVGYLRMHMQEVPPPFRTIKPDLPALPQLESVVMKALTKERNQRYSSVLEFARAFVAASPPSAQAAVPVPPPSTRIVSPPAVAKRPQLQAAPGLLRKIKFAVIAGVALIVIVAGVWYLSQHGAKIGNISSPSKAVESKGEARVIPNDGLKYVWIPPGTFMMGCSPGDTGCGDDEKPPHQVTITKGFWLGQTEATVGAYKRFAGATGRQMPPEPDIGGRPLNTGWRDDAMPIVGVTWDEARTYCSWTGGRLPTEAEWEYAARAGSTAARYGDLDEIAWYANNSGRQRLDFDRIFKVDMDNSDKHLKENGNGMHEAGQKRANGFGLYDMLGNVSEWVNDYYTDRWVGESQYYRNGPSQNPEGPASGPDRIWRGGSWSLFARYARASFRNRCPHDTKFNGLGFRCGRKESAP